MSVYRLTNPLKDYGWGSPDFIPSLLGQTPDPQKPVAEMWMGAHALASSQIVFHGGQISLAEFIRDNPGATLGKAAGLNDSQLSFLLKILAATQPLSIQAHPSLLQAQQGFARENSLGVPLTSPLRNYKDANHKPELICALTPFRAMCGFRPYIEIIENFQNAGLDSFFSTFSAFTRFADQRSFQKFFLQILYLAGPEKQLILDRYNAILLEKSSLPEDIINSSLFLQRFYPSDTGILAPLYLNLFTLQPGEALFLPSGVLHAYLEGAGIELMANSDNVLRGGLTPKHMDVEELARILDFSPYIGSKVVPDPAGVYHSPAKEFTLRRLNLGGDEVQALSTKSLPVILFCESGALEISEKEESVQLRKGESAFISANSEAMTLRGKCSIWVASVPEAQN